MGDSKKRKSHSTTTHSKGAERIDSKRTKRIQSKTPQTNDSNNTKKITVKHSSGVKPTGKFTKSSAPAGKSAPMTKRELRLAAKEKAEARKQKRKRHYSLEKELAILWEKFRVCKGRSISKEERSKFISEALGKMHGKIHEIATSHVSSRILQTCVRFCTQEERDAVFEELRPHLLALSTNVYAVHLVNKLLDNASKSQLDWFISSLHGHVSSLLRHMVGSVVVEHIFQLGNGSQKRQLLSELYSPELQLFKDLTLGTEGRLVDIISKMGLNKSSVLQHMTSVIQPILEKGIADHSVIHTLLKEYFSIADKSSAADVIQQISGSLLVRMIHTRDGSKVGILCIRHGSAKERKKIIKAMKGLVGKIAHDQYSCLVLISILSHVDDTKLLTKFVIRELQPILKALLLDKNGRRPVLELLRPHCRSYFSRDDLTSLSSSIPCFCTKDNTSESTDATQEKNIESSNFHEDDSRNSVLVHEEKLHVDGSAKKDPIVRRRELLDSGLAECLIDTCIENIEELLFSHIGKDAIYEVAVGGADAILSQPQSEKLESLHEVIASLATKPKEDESKDEHVMENFHANRTIRKLILDSPAFASTFWNSALKGRCKMWSQGHSMKVVSAYLESSDTGTRNLAIEELQPLVDSGVLQILDGTQKPTRKSN